MDAVPSILTNMAFRQSRTWIDATSSICRDAETPDELLAGWQQATLANMQADAAQARRSDFRPTGGLPLAHAQRIAAQGRRGDGRAVAAQAVWSARAAPEGGGVELLHAVMYAERPQPAVADAFFEGIKWP